LPSFPELHDDVQVVGAPPAGPVAPADVLARVKAEGLRRRTRRHRRNGVLAALGIALLAVPAVALLPEDGDDDVTVAAEGDGDAAPRTTEAHRPTTTVSTAATATTAPPTTVVVEGGDVGLVPPLVIEREAPVTTVPAPVCRNSTDAACGEFRWDPAPAANQPLTAGFGPSTEATAGVPFTIEVNWADPDAADLTFDHFSPDGVGLARACTIEPRYGPWTPPAPARGAGQLRYTHTFEAPGTYTVVVSLGTADCNSPYGSDVTVEQTITVTAGSA
jgi:hypothetical protein